MQDITIDTEVRKRRLSEDGFVNKRGKKASVSFPEMLRLMNTYGSIKCLRNRQKNVEDNINNTKSDSVRRKFYRWFPDLDERFKRDNEGIYHPKYGHEFEINHRELMRKLDGELLAAKRTGSRKEHLLNSREAKSPSNKKALIHARARQAGVITVTSDDVAPPMVILSAISAQESDDMVALIPHHFHDSPQESAAIISDIEPVDMSFIAEREIFDDVENSFFSPTIEECPSSRMQFCSPTQENADLYRSHQISPTCDTNYDTPFIDDIIDKSIEECCDQRSWGRMDSDTTFFKELLVKSVEECEECYDDNVLVSEDSDSDVSWDFFE